MPDLSDAFRTTPIAHRAYHDRAQGQPENSRAAIRAAVAAGYGIEIDVQMSRDRQAMVFHDDDLDRLTLATGPVRARDATALHAIGLRDAEDGIPTLPDVLALVDGKVPLLIEVKDQDGALGPDVGPLEEAVAQALRGYAGPVALMSFNPHSVRRMAALCPEIPRGLTTCAYEPGSFDGLTETRRSALAAISAADDIDLQFLSHHHTDLANPRVQALRARGLSLLCWTITSPEEEAAARQLADNVTFEGYAA